MPRFPYMNFPFQSYRNFSRIPPHFAYNQMNSTPKTIPNYYKESITHSNISEEAESSRSFTQKNKSNKNIDNYLFDLFGLKIYHDDVLLVSLIYFLYSEGVKDDGLFIVLILLLLS